jgi:Fur family transcriptional regulator, peroxide stress response regulator
MIDRFIQICKEANLNITPQRIVIYRELAELRGHPDAETIYRRVKKQFPSISLATVYKTLDTFVRIGLLSPFRSGSGSTRYDTNLEEHHHLVCIDCDTVIDVNHESLTQLPVHRLPLSGFKIINHQVEIKGICSDCQRKRAATAI